MTAVSSVSEGRSSERTPQEQEHRLHKSRQRQRRADEKDAAIRELLGRWPDFDEGQMSSLFTDIDLGGSPLVDDSGWEGIAAALTPDESRLDERTAASPEMLKGEEVRQKKYRKKLLAQLKDGDISAEKMEGLLAKFGREKGKVSECNGDDCQCNGPCKDFSLMNADRALRKKQQIANFASIIQRFMADGREFATIADFGCGSGNLCLPLAKVFPQVSFLLMDRNAHCLEIARRRAVEGSVSNVAVLPYEFRPDRVGREITEQEIPRFDLAIGLHSCGSFTDMVMELCAARNADCVVCPCCNGKMGDFREEARDARDAADPTSGPSVTPRVPPASFDQLFSYPRSSRFSTLFSRAEWLLSLARSADDVSGMGLGEECGAPWSD